MLDLTQTKDAHRDQRLRSEAIVWLTTVRPDGRPHSVPVWFLWDGAQVLIFSQPKTQKIRNLRQNPHVFIALDNTKDGEDVVMFEGTAELLEQSGVNTTIPAYVKKYAEMIKDLGLTPETMGASYSQAIRITPTKFIG